MCEQGCWDAVGAAGWVMRPVRVSDDAECGVWTILRTLLSGRACRLWRDLSHRLEVPPAPERDFILTRFI